MRADPPKRAQAGHECLFRRAVRSLQPPAGAQALFDAGGCICGCERCVLEDADLLALQNAPELQKAHAEVRLCGIVLNERVLQLLSQSR